LEVGMSGTARAADAREEWRWLELSARREVMAPRLGASFCHGSRLAGIQFALTPAGATPVVR
jgi:hypothetical protein